MSRHIFSPKPGITRVQAGADPRIEITPAKPFTTSDPGIIAELRANPFLNVKTPPARNTAKKPTKPKTIATAVTPPPAAPVAPAAPVVPADGGAS
jgi:hypothetical protein